MKTIFSVLSSFIFLFIQIVCVGQNCDTYYYNYTQVYTPNETSVTACLLKSGMDLEGYEKLYWKNFWLDYYDNRITYLNEATRKYNCHSYAWHVTQGGNLVWISNPGDDEYWNDCSYHEVATQSAASKVSFVDGDHSANTTGTTNIFASKWGMSPLFIHNVNDCPYDNSPLKYYVREGISGDNIVCSSNKTFTLNNRQSGKSVTWYKSSNLQYVSGQGTDNYIVKAQSGASGSGWVKAVVPNDCSGNNETIKNVWVGPYNSTEISITGDSYLCPYEIGSYYATTPPGVTDYDWNVYNGLQIYYEDGPNLAVIAPDNYSTWIIELKVNNGCGWSTVPKMFYVNRDYPCYGGYYYSIYPNPANSEVNIEAVPDESLLTSGGDFSVDFNVVVYNLNKIIIGEATSKNNKASLKLQNVSEGLYFVQIVDKNRTTKKPLLIE
jgi:hypothetical protein